MPRIDHVAVESENPEAAAAFYERFFEARIVRTEGHPVMAYLGTTSFALHEPGGPGPHTGIRVSEQELEELKRELDSAGIAWRERDHGIALGVFFDDPDGRRVEAIWYRGGEDPRRP
jgi:catechol 2,3-dioxygenase-like lactoylglutathione lyase family enzyme